MHPARTVARHLEELMIDAVCEHDTLTIMQLNPNLTGSLRIPGLKFATTTKIMSEVYIFQQILIQFPLQVNLIL